MFIKNAICISSVFIGIMSLLLPSAYAKIEEPYPVKPQYSEYIGRATEREYLPVTVLYDPYGDKSYQKIATSTTISTTFEMKGGAAGYKAKGSVGTSLTYETSYQSSVSTNPADIGPGKGDRIIGKIYQLTWDVYEIVPAVGSWYYYYSLVYPSGVGTFVLSRSDLARSSDTWVEDRTGFFGAYRHLWDISANTPVEHGVSYSWSGSLSVGYEFKVNILGIEAAEIGFSLTFAGTQTYAVKGHYEDTTRRLTFYENAERAPDNFINTVYTYVFWYSQA